jgi:signal peptidase II
VKRILGIATVAFVIDQVTKFYILHILDLPRIGQMPVFDGFKLSMAWNRGINFGLFASEHDNSQYILIGLSVLISAILFFWGRKLGRTIHLGVGLIIGGALGNALDRAIYQGVADFLNVTCCGINNPYAFNIADICIFLGAFVLILFNGKPEKPAPAPSGKPS